MIMSKKNLGSNKTLCKDVDKYHQKTNIKDQIKVTPVSNRRLMRL